MVMLIKRLCLSLMLLSFIAFVSCDKSEDENPVIAPDTTDITIHVTGLTIDQSKVVAIPTQTTQLFVSVLPGSAPNKNVTWSSSDDAVATVDQNGLVTAIKEGHANITATSVDNTPIKATAKFSILADYDVYAVGRDLIYYWGGYAVYWKNGVKSALESGSNAVGIMFSGEDEYIVGKIDGFVVYWKNGTPHIIGEKPPFADNIFVTGIAVDGGKVYVTGYTFNSEGSGRCRASYFLDNEGVTTQTDLFNEVSSTVANGILVKGGEVFVVGGQANDNYYQWTTLWKNGVSDVAVLSPMSGYYEATAIGQLGNDIYITANGGCGDIGCNNTAYLLRNNIDHSTALTDGSLDAKALCMAFSGNTIYVGGYEKNTAGRYVAKYWKIADGQISARVLSDGTKSTVVQGIAVHDNDVFLIGNELTERIGEPWVYKAKCWRMNESFSPVASFDVSDRYAPEGYNGNAIYIR